MNMPTKKPACFLKTHEALQHILGDVDFLGERRSFETAAKRFGEFRLMLEQHLKNEDEVLLPRFMRAVQDHGETVERMHAHRTHLLRCVEGVASTITGGDFAAFCTAMSELEQALEAHRSDEEHVVHPALERVLRSDADWENLCNQVHFTRAEPA